MQKKDSIKKAAWELFTLYGVKKTSIAEIARRAGADPVTIYNHFRDKAALVREVVKDFVEAQWRTYQGILDSGLSFQEKLNRIMAAKTALAAASGSKLPGRLLEERAAADQVAALFDKEINPAVARFIKSGQASGDVRNDLSLETIRLYIDMFTDLARTHPEVVADRARASKTSKEIWDLFLYGLMGRKRAVGK